MTANISQHVTPRRRSLSSQSWRVFQRRRRWPRQFRKDTLQRGSIDSTTLSLSLGIIVVIAIALLSFYYLGQVLNTTSQGTDVQSLEERLVELNEKQRELELESAELRSIDIIEQQVQELNLVTTDQVAYLHQGLDRVARNEQ